MVQLGFLGRTELVSGVAIEFGLLTNRAILMIYLHFVHLRKYILDVLGLRPQTAASTGRSPAQTSQLRHADWSVRRLRGSESRSVSQPATIAAFQPSNKHGEQQNCNCV